jgi:nicotinamidase-related amidase
MRRKYISGFKIEMNTSGKTLKVLIAVDIQNCFIHGGSLGAPLANTTEEVYNKGKYEAKNGVASLQQAKEVLEMMEGKDIVVITRDSHPDNHKSFISEQGLFPPHCRKSKKGLKPQHAEIQSCKTMNNKPAAEPEVMPEVMPASNMQPNKPMNGGAKYKNYTGAEQELVGTDPSMAFDFAAEGNETYKQYVAKIKNCDLNVGFANVAGNQKKAIQDVTFACERSPVKQAGMPIFIDLRKGEKCDMDAYSAFNYHVIYDGPVADRNDVPCSFGTSTMLLETLLSQQIKDAVGSFSKVEVDVCGLVGNICVMYTATYGSQYAQMAAADPAAFQTNYARLPGLTYGGSVPSFHFNFHGRKGTQWLRTTDGKTPYPYNPNGQYPNMNGNDPATIKFEHDMIEVQAKKQGPNVLKDITIMELNGPSGGGRRKMKTRKNCWPKRKGGARKGTRKPMGHKKGCKCVVCKRR